jgi:protein TonB
MRGDSTISLIAAVGFHATILFVIPVAFPHAPIRSRDPIEVDLVAAQASAQVESVEVPKAAPEPVMPAISKPAVTVAAPQVAPPPVAVPLEPIREKTETLPDAKAEDVYKPATEQPVPVAAVVNVPTTQNVTEIPEAKSEIVPPLTSIPATRTESLAKNVGAQSDVPSVLARPRYRNNPEPIYPASARRKRQQGTVLLSVLVDAKGRPEKVSIKQGCGISALDEAALVAVRTWEFDPAMIGTRPIKSEIEVPVRFVLTP